MANSFHIPIFKTDCIDDMPFEKYRILVALLNEMHKEVPTEQESSSGYSNSKVKRTTFRIENEG